MNRKFDDITRLFQKTLGEDTAGNSGWDEPSGAVWRGVEEHLQKKRRRRGFIWFWFIGILAVSLTAYNLFPRENDGTQTKVIPLADAPRVISNTEAVEVGAEVPAAPVSTMQSGGGHAPVQNAGQLTQAQSSAQQSGVHLAPRSSEYQVATQPQKETESAPLNSVAVFSTNSPLKDALVDREIFTTSLEHSPMVPVDVLAVKPSLLNYSYELPAIETGEKQQSGSRWMLGAYVAPSLGTRHIAIATNRTDFAKVLLQQQETPVVKLSLGASIAYMASSKWDVGIGLEYAAIQLKSDYLKQVRYSRVGETTSDQGLLASKYQVNINGSYGRIETDIIIERERDMMIPENTFINVDFQMEQSLEFLRVPLFARYHIRMGGARLHGIVGMTLQHLSSSMLDFRAVQSMNDEVRRVQTLRTGVLEGTSTTTLGYQIGMGAEIPVSERLSLSVAPMINGSFSPVYRSEAVKVYPFSLDFRVGVFYYLRSK